MAEKDLYRVADRAMRQITRLGRTQKGGVRKAAPVVKQVLKEVVKHYSKQGKAKPKASGSRTSTRSRTAAGGSSSRVYLGQSKSSGFVGGFKKWRRRGRPNTMSQIQRRGVIVSREYGYKMSIGAADSLIFGHTNFLLDHIWIVTWATLLKRLCLRRGYVIQNFREEVSQEIMPPGYKLYLQAITGRSPDTSQAYDILLWDAPSGPTAWWDMVITISNTTRSWLVNNHHPNAHFGKLYLTHPAGGKVDMSIPLIGCKMQFNLKSSLKIQNQTGPDDIEVKTAEPVYGRSYEGRGTGTASYRDGVATNFFVCSSDTGTFKNVDPQIASGLQEGPPPGYFKQVKKVSKLHLDPGQIKTSNLLSRHSIYLNQIVNLIAKMEDGYDSYILTRFGRFRMFHLEHLLKEAADDPNIQIVWEHQVRTGATCRLKWTTVTDELKMDTKFEVQPSQ
ncbi:MAG: hypothetical protein QW356_08975 [Candidatus Hadarchaeales archaeon]